MRFFFVFLLFNINFWLQGQSYYHHVGLQTNFVWYTVALPANLPGVSFGESAVFPGITYKGSLAFDLNNSAHFAVSTYPFLGFDLIAYNNVTSSSIRSLVTAEIPLLAELYFGYGKMSDASFYIGSGLSAIHLVKNSTESMLQMATGTDSGLVFGFCNAVGSQFFIGSKLISFKFSYTHGLTELITTETNDIIANNFYQFSILHQLGNKTRVRVKN